jgi:hypothetical protein
MFHGVSQKTKYGICSVKIWIALKSV